jgi:hypothetical protein
MSSAVVAEALGSPNIVATDEDGREVKSTENNGWVVFVWGDQRDAATSQRTLTVIAKLDETGLVRDSADHSTSFRAGSLDSSASPSWARAQRRGPLP